MHRSPAAMLLMAFTAFGAALRVNAADLFVASAGGNNQDVRRFNGTTGAIVPSAIHPSTNSFAADFNLVGPQGLAFGPDGNLYVASGSGEILRFNGTTGSLIDHFVPFSNNPGALTNPIGVAFGPNGNLFVADLTAGDIRQFNGATGAALGTFNSGFTLAQPQGITFGPDHNLYVADSPNGGEILQFNGATGAFKSIFVPFTGSGNANSLDNPQDVAFGPDGNLYVSDATDNKINRYVGSGLNAGAFIDTFVGSAALFAPRGIAFGPSGNLFVANANNDSVEQFNGSSGADLGVFASNGLASPSFLVFAAPEPVSLALMAAGVPLLAFKRARPR